MADLFSIDSSLCCEFFRKWCKIANISEKDRHIFVSLDESFAKLLSLPFMVQIINKLLDFVRNIRCNVLGNDAQEQTLLLLFLKLQPEGGLNAAPLVKEAPAHVDVRDISEEPSHEVDACVEDDVRPELLIVVCPCPVALLPRLELVVDNVVRGGGGADRQNRDAETDRECHTLSVQGK